MGKEFMQKHRLPALSAAKPNATRETVSQQRRIHRLRPLLQHVAQEIETIITVVGKVFYFYLTNKTVHIKHLQSDLMLDECAEMLVETYYEH